MAKRVDWQLAWICLDFLKTATDAFINSFFSVFIIYHGNSACGLPNAYVQENAFLYNMAFLLGPSFLIVLSVPKGTAECH